MSCSRRQHHHRQSQDENACCLTPEPEPERLIRGLLVPEEKKNAYGFSTLEHVVQAQAGTLG